MTCAYDESYLSVIQDKLGNMFELAVIYMNMDIDAFTDIFLASKVCIAMERADPVFVLGKSATELLALVLEIEPYEIIQSPEYSPEYWVGYALANVQWELNVPFSKIIKAYPCSRLVLDYFPYHEMDIRQTRDMLEPYITGQKNVITD